MKIIKNGWTFIRCLGAGDVEHVRHSLLNVGFLGANGIVDQLGGAIVAADALGMMLRANVNFDRVPKNEVLHFMHRNTTHQLENWTGLTKETFKSIFSRIDIIIVPGDTPADAQVIIDGINELWDLSDGRFLQGNFARKSRAKLLEAHPEVNHDLTSLWKVWNA